jgi:hypothetical protein
MKKYRRQSYRLKVTKTRTGLPRAIRPAAIMSLSFMRQTLIYLPALILISSCRIILCRLAPWRRHIALMPAGLSAIIALFVTFIAQARLLLAPFEIGAQGGGQAFFSLFAFAHDSSRHVCKAV